MFRSLSLELVIGTSGICCADGAQVSQSLPFRPEPVKEVAELDDADPAESTKTTALVKLLRGAEKGTQSLVFSQVSTVP